ncbi:helix-turn-helix domain-containing protein [Aquimarina spinulae]|uniref:helix-turn-helix domain-containing protein n=1 Tax=Aquimarina spinulae TaxID=1192023 RepID=UPI000D558189|nr:helix-turn-helix domain-containing protein [Aquimarina spinulae]
MILITLLNIAIFQGVVLGIIILKSPIFKSKANKYLAYAIFSISISLLNYVLDDIGVYTNIPLLSFIDTIDSGLLFPVFIFLYVAHQIDHPIKKSRKIIWLFVPYLYSTIVDIFDDINITTNLDTPYNFILLFLNIIQILIILFFIPGILIYAFVLISYSKNTQEKRWLTHLWLLTATLFGSWILTVLSSILLEYDFTSVMKILTVIATFLMHWISYFGIFKFRLAKDQEEIRALIDKRKNDSTTEIVTDVKLSKIHDAKKAESFTKEHSYFKKLEDLCVNHHIYRDSTLDRDKVAEMLGISTGYVSQLVNTVTGDNFTTYINHYRVEAVKDLILNSEFDNYSLLAIGLECGFSSKSTFHNAFKKITGTTPNAYRKKYK